MVRKRKPRKSEAKRLSTARIILLWDQASEISKTDPDGARRRMEVASKLAQKARIKVPRPIKRRICRNCRSILIPGENCRVRMRNNRSKHLTVTCLVCGDIKRHYVR